MRRLKGELREVRRVASSLGIGACVSFCLLGGAVHAGAQSSDHVRLTLFETSAPTEARSCTLEVVVGQTTGEAILTCERRVPPVSQLSSHRALTPSEAARLYELASVPATSRPQGSLTPPPANAERARSTLTITRGADRVVLDVSEDATPLAPDDQQVLRLIRAIADELR